MLKTKSLSPLCRSFGALLFGCLNFLVYGQHELSKSSYSPKVSAASDQGEQAIKRFKVAPGLRADLFAAEPHLANPVAFCFDEQGRVYVAETFRLGSGVGDIRGIMDWLNDELASRSVDERLAYMKRRLGPKVQDWTRESERVKMLVDSDGDGRIDQSSVFADGFNSLVDGLGSGVLARKGNVYFANIPNLWLLRDTDGDGTADLRKSLHYGYGVRLGFIGHDLHGLRFGPDGKLYFTIGDRGAHIFTEGHYVGHPEMGDVFRCNPDGSELEVFAFGLRNPQELAFDQYGNLFTGDNNSDSGDKARWVYLVEGGDSGWRVGYQFMERPYARGPFNQEKIWHPQFEGQAAYIVPPITNITAGPSGLTYYPGTGLPDKYNEHFFLADFHGSENSRVHSFKMRPKGASFELVESELLVQGLLATDVEFGVDGGVYVSDWVKGWATTGKGRIYRFHDPAVDQSPVVVETKRLLAEGMEKRSVKELASLLSHPDMRVRQEAQFEMAEREFGAIKPLAEVALKNSKPLARLHAIWGLGQIASRTKLVPKAEAWPAVQKFLRGFRPDRPVQYRRGEGWVAIETLLRLLEDKDSEVRAQAAKVLGELRVLQAYDALIVLLQDASPRVRFFTMMSLGKLGRREAVSPLLSVLRDNAEQDPYIRHAGVQALTWINEVDSLLAASNDSSATVRMAVLLALRRLHRPEVNQFLRDAEPLIVLEAARAINDQPINGAMMELAALLNSSPEISNFRPDLREPLLRRIINACLRVGTPDTAQMLVRFAADSRGPDPMRAEALLALSNWPHPSDRDRVVGLWRPIPSARSASAAVRALEPALTNLLSNAPEAVQVAAIEAIERIGISEALPALLPLIKDTQLPSRVRLAALGTLATFPGPLMAEAIRMATADQSEALRAEATRLQARLPASEAITPLTLALEKGSITEKQSAFAALALLSNERVNPVLDQWLDRLMAGQVPAEVQLDLMQAAIKRSSKPLQEKLARYEASLPKNDGLAPYRVALRGGEALAGKRIFLERQDAACAKCHKIGGEGGEVGPELTGIGGKKDRNYLLESILFPNKQIAPGFESVLVTTKNGAQYAGIAKNENAGELVLNSPEDGIVIIKKADIKARERGLSAMPEGINSILSKEELRDLIEFLASSK